MVQVLTSVTVKLPLSDMLGRYGVRREEGEKIFMRGHYRYQTRLDPLKKSCRAQKTCVLHLKSIRGKPTTVMLLMYGALTDGKE